MPFDLPGVKLGSDIESLFKAVGFVVVQWDHAEQCLDLMVAAIFQLSVLGVTRTEKWRLRLFSIEDTNHESSVLRGYRHVVH